MLQELKPSWLVWCQLTWIDLDSNGSGRESRDGFEFTVGLVCFLPYYVIILYIYIIKYIIIHPKTMAKRWSTSHKRNLMIWCHALLSLHSLHILFVRPGTKFGTAFAAAAPCIWAAWQKGVDLLFFGPLSRIACHVMSTHNKNDNNYDLKSKIHHVYPVIAQINPLLLGYPFRKM